MDNTLETRGWIPVFKNDDTREVRNLRPVTVLPALGKVDEKQYMDPKLSHALSAYRKNNGFYGLQRLWKQDLDCKRVVGVLTSDIRKAFMP